MSTVWKYPLPGFGRHEVELPKGATIRMINTDPATDRPAIWCEVDPKEWRNRERVFWTVATDDTVPDDAEFRGSGITKGGFVFHVYEETV